MSSSSSNESGRVLSCPRCKRDLSSSPGDIIVCPYCGAFLKEAKQITPQKKWKKLIYSGLTTLMLAVFIFFFIPLLALFLLPVALILLALGLRRYKAYSKPASAPLTKAYPPPLEKEIVKLSKTERYIRKTLGASIFLFIILAFLSNPIVIFFPIPLAISIAFGVYLLRNKGYRTKLDIFWVLLGLITYIIPALTTASFFSLKALALTADFGSEGADPYTQAFLFLSVSNIIVFGSATFLLVTDVSPKIKAVTKSPRRGLISVVILLITLGILLGLPWLHQPTVSSHATGVGGPGPGATFGIVNESTAHFDAQKNLWVYQLTIASGTGENGEIIKIIGRGPKKQVLPPFGENIEVIGGEKTAEKIVVKPGTRATLIIYSKDPLWNIALIDQKGKCCNITFWS